MHPSPHSGIAGARSPREGWSALHEVRRTRCSARPSSRVRTRRRLGRSAGAAPQQSARPRWGQGGRTAGGGAVLVIRRAARSPEAAVRTAAAMTVAARLTAAPSSRTAPPGAACASRKVTGRRPGVDGRALGGLRRSARCYPCVDGISRRRTPLEATVVTTAVKARSIPVLPIRAGGSGQPPRCIKECGTCARARTGCVERPAVAGTVGEVTSCVPGSARSCAPTQATTPTAAARGSAPRSAEPGNACERQVGGREHCSAGTERAVAASRRATTRPGSA